MKTSKNTKFVLTSASGILVKEGTKYKTSSIENFDSVKDFEYSIVFFETLESAQSFLEENEMFGLAVTEFAGVDAY